MGLFTKIKSFFGRTFGINRTFNQSFRSVTGFTMSNINSNSIYLDSIYNRLSTDIANINLQHIKQHLSEGVTVNNVQHNSDISYVLSFAPNRYDTPASFWTEVALGVIKNGITVVLPVYSSGRLTELMIIDDYEIITNDKNEQAFIINGNLLDYNDLIVFRNVNNGLFNNLYEISNILSSAMDNLSMKIEEDRKGIRGFLKLSTKLSDETMKKSATNRINDINGVANGSEGISYLQKDEEFQELNSKFDTLSTDHLEFLKQQLFENYGVNADIISSSFTEEQYKAYMQNIIEPYQRMIVQTLNKSLFTKTAYTQGNRIINPVDIFKFSSIKETADAIKSLKYTGVLNSNEARMALGLSSYVGGDRFETNANAIEINETEEDLEKQEI